MRFKNKRPSLRETQILYKEIKKWLIQKESIPIRGKRKEGLMMPSLFPLFLSAQTAGRPSRLTGHARSAAIIKIDRLLKEQKNKSHRKKDETD